MPERYSSIPSGYMTKEQISVASTIPVRTVRWYMDLPNEDCRHLRHKKIYVKRDASDYGRYYIVAEENDVTAWMGIEEVTRLMERRNGRIYPRR